MGIFDLSITEHTFQGELPPLRGRHLVGYNEEGQHCLIDARCYTCMGIIQC